MFSTSRPNTRFHRLAVFFSLSLPLLIAPQLAVAGVAMDCPGSVKALSLQGYKCHCSGGQLLCDGKGHTSGSAAGGMQAMIAATVVESLLSTIFASPATGPAQNNLAEQQKATALAAQYLAQKKTKEAEEQAAYARMMQSYRQLEGATDVNFKALPSTDLAFKTLDGEMEGIASTSRKPFDTPSTVTAPTPESTGSASPFFGDTMPTEQIQALVNPDNDPKVVDLRSAVTFIVGNLKKDSQQTVDAASPPIKDKGSHPTIKPSGCAKLSQRLRGYIDQRNKFHKTILLANEQLTTWEYANRNALVNAVKDGVEYFAGLYLDILKNRGLAAERLRGIYEKRAVEMASDGLDVAAIKSKINRLQAMSSIGKFSEVANNANNANDWQTFMKDGMSTLVNQLSSSNDEIQEMLADPRMQKYFTPEAPELNTLLDISKIAASNKVLGKWVAKKMPLIAMLEFSIKQSYNATDWYQSFQRVKAANKINGEVMNAARSLQRNIDDTYFSLQQCPRE